MGKARRPTLKDIAASTGYSINTVSKAFMPASNLSGETRARILEVARLVGYVANASASAMRSGVTRTIAVIVGDISNPHFAIMVKEIETLARAHHYSIMVLNTDESDDREAEAVEVALRKGVDGILLCPVQQSLQNVQRIIRAQVPFVLLGRHFEGLSANAVVCDDVQGGELATAHLIALGHRRICFLNAPGHISSAKERFQGYCNAHKTAGLPVDPALVHTVSLRQEARLQQLQAIVENLTATAIFAFSDVIAWEGITLLQARGLTVPQDVSVIGFDNLLSKLPYPFALTSVRTSKTLMSVEALKMLIQQMEEPDAVAGLVAKKVISTSVAVRQSTARCVPERA